MDLVKILRRPFECTNSLMPHNPKPDVTIGTGVARRAMELLGSGVIQTEKMTTHRFPCTEAAAAFDLLYNRMAETLGVLFDWEGQKFPKRGENPQISS